MFIIKKTTNEFIKNAKKKHGDKYDYSKVEYSNNHTKVCIICPEHGEFWQTPNKHLRGDGCPICRINKKLTLSNFVERAKIVHDNKYDYSKTNYINNRTKICIICPEHGEFWQLPSMHLRGCGCPKCKNVRSYMEKTVEKLLTKENIKFETEKTFDWLKYKRQMRIDFYLPEFNMAIECQGEQHLKPVKFFGGEKELEYVQKRDEYKKKLCEKHGIKILYIFENEIKKKNNNDILDKIKNAQYNFISWLRNAFVPTNKRY